MRIVIVTIIVIIAMVLVLTYIYFTFREERQLKSDLSNLSARLESLLNENKRLKSEIEYFSNPENLEKELRKKFNLRKPDEKMMIVVP